jgi:hypothetical protein
MRSLATAKIEMTRLVRKGWQQNVAIPEDLFFVRNLGPR